MAFSKYYDVKTDLAFKRIFGTEKNKNILLSFLNAVLKKQLSGTIHDVTFLKTSQDPDTAARKQSLVDVLCKDETGVQYIIEMQVVKGTGFEERAQYYACRAYIDQMNKGEQYKDLKEVIFIAIADYEVFPNKHDYKSEHMILDKKTHERDLDKLSFTFIDLTKFDKEERDIRNMTLEEKWYYFLKNADETEDKELDEWVGEDMIIREAYKELDRFNWSKEERNAYDQEMKRIRDNAAIEDQKLQDAERRGETKGKMEGLEEGAKKEKAAIAGNLLAAGLSIDLVMQATGLTKKEIETLSSDLSV